MRPHRSLWSIVLTLLIPQPLFAIESGVTAMQTAVEFEKEQSITAWVMQEFRDMVTGFRDTLEPLIPRNEIGFDLMKAQINSFVQEGQEEQTRILELIEQRSEQDPEPIAPMPDETMVAEIQMNDAIPFFYSEQESKMLPELTFNEKGQLSIDTSKGINLPDLEIDPRNGGTYQSELTVLQEVLDTVQFLQDQIPAPIQSAGNNLYDKLTGITDAEQRGH